LPRRVNFARLAETASGKTSWAWRLFLVRFWSVVTLRTYPDLIEASLAKSALEVNGIPCSLADENANAYSAAKIAIPIRLLVADDQIEEANRILDAIDKKPPGAPDVAINGNAARHFG
jgi:hypothetical protein